MSVTSMAVGDSRIGFLFDGSGDGLAPYSGILSLDEKKGILIHVPSMNPRLFSAEPAVRASLEKAYNLADAPSGDVPRTLVHRGVHGAATLTGVHGAGYSRGGTGMSQAKLRAEAAVFAQPVEFLHEYKVKEFSSTIDGLDEFCSFRGFFFADHLKPGDERNPPIQTLPPEVVAWNSGGFRFELESQTSTEGQEGNYFRLNVGTRLRTIAENGATILDHYAAQRKVRAFLVLNFGCRLPWRSHSLTDAQFPARMYSGESGPAIPVMVVLAQTLAEHVEPDNTTGSLFLPLLLLQGIDAESLAIWCDRYDDNDFRRAVEPGVEAIAARVTFAEPAIMMLSSALDRFGYCATGKRSRRPLDAHVRHCLDAVGVNWTPIGSNEGLAKFIAGVNNALKHPDYAHRPDRDGYPGHLGISAAKILAEAVVRAQILPAIAATERLPVDSSELPPVREAREFFEHHGLTVDDSGALHIHRELWEQKEE